MIFIKSPGGDLLEHEFNEKMRLIKERVIDKEFLNNKLVLVNQKLEEKNAELKELSKKLEKERRNVENLKRFSLSNIIATIANNKPEKLMREETELFKVQKVFNRLADELKDIEKEKKDIISGQNKILALEREYRNLQTEKKLWILSLNTEVSKTLKSNLDLVEKIEESLSWIERAIKIGNLTFTSTTSAMQELISASTINQHHFHEPLLLFGEFSSPEDEKSNSKSAFAAEAYFGNFKSVIQSVTTDLKQLIPKLESPTTSFDLLTDTSLIDTLYKTQFVADADVLQRIRNSVDSLLEELKLAFSELKLQKDHLEKMNEILILNFE